MKRFALMILFSALFLLFPKLAAIAGEDKNMLEEIIEKIENKYKELRKNASFVKANGVPVAQHIRFIQPQDQIIKDYSKLRQIALVRHGEPDMVKEGKFTREEANQYLKCYDSVCIIVPDKPFFNIGYEEEVAVFSSPLNRALTTAQYLCGSDKEITVSADYREFENKISESNSQRRWPIKLLTATERLKWMLGGGKKKGIESFSNAKKRARKAAQNLADASENNLKVLLTAHGFLNRYIKKNLEKMGWVVVEETGNNYFGTTILVKVVKK